MQSDKSALVSPNNEVLKMRALDKEVHIMEWLLRNIRKDQTAFQWTTLLLKFPIILWEPLLHSILSLLLCPYRCQTFTWFPLHLPSCHLTFSYQLQCFAGQGLMAACICVTVTARPLITAITSTHLFREPLRIWQFTQHTLLICALFKVCGSSLCIMVLLHPFPSFNLVSSLHPE